MYVAGGREKKKGAMDSYVLLRHASKVKCILYNTLGVGNFSKGMWGGRGEGRKKQKNFRVCLLSFVGKITYLL